MGEQQHDGSAEYYAASANAVLASLMAPAGPALSAEALQAAQDAAQCHQAYGAGLYDGRRGEAAHFTVQTYEPSGAARSAGGDDIAVAVVSSAEEGGLTFAHTPVDNGDGTYTCEYTPGRAGPYQLRVTCGGHDIYGSPFYPLVAAAPTAAAHCRVGGPGAALARVGEGGAAGAASNTVRITAVDAFDEARGGGGDVFVLSISRPGRWSRAGNDGEGNFTAIDCGDGTYVAEYEVDTLDPTAYA